MVDDAPRPGPRVVVRISPEMQFLLTQVAMRLACQKKELHDAIWCAGLAAHLGVTPEEVDQAQLASLPRTVAAKDARHLAQLMLSNR